MTEPFHNQRESMPDGDEPFHKRGNSLVAATIIALAVAPLVMPSEEYVEHKIFRPTVDQTVDFIDTVLPG